MENSIGDRIEEKYTRYLNCETDTLELTIEEAIFILETDESLHYVEDLLQEAYKVILSDYKRVLKENEILKEEKEQAWEEWNNLEQGSYETELKLKEENRKLKAEMKDGVIAIKLYALQTENEKLKNKIEHYQKLQHNYIEKYDEINEGLQAMISALQELLESEE